MQNIEGLVQARRCLVLLCVSRVWVDGWVSLCSVSLCMFLCVCVCLYTPVCVCFCCLIVVSSRLRAMLDFEDAAMCKLTVCLYSALCALRITK